MPAGIYKRKSIEERLWPKINMFTASGCWEWKACLDGKGYGQFNINSKHKRAHKVVYELLIEKVPDLEPVTHRENIMRTESVLAKNATKTHCSNGHEYTSQNTYNRPLSGILGRDCRKCRYIRSKEAYQRVRLRRLMA